MILLNPVSKKYLFIILFIIHVSSLAFATDQDQDNRKVKYPAFMENTSVSIEKSETPLIPQNNIKKIAVLLPLSGGDKQAGHAVREGILNAYYHASKHHASDHHASNHQASHHDEYELQFYDTEKASPEFLYEQALKSGSDAIIGPLKKEQVDALYRYLYASQQTLTQPENTEEKTDQAQQVAAPMTSIPILAMNHSSINHQPLANLYGFSLSPEDEMEALIKHVQDRYHSVLLISNGTAFSKRLEKKFTADWEEAQKNLLPSVYFNQRNVHTMVASLTKLKATIDTSSFILLLASAQEMKDLLPQIQATRFNTLPIYTNSAAVNPSELINQAHSIHFCDIPLFIKQPEEISTDFIRLKSFGFDGFRLVLENFITDKTVAGHLSDSYAGRTGQLSFTEDHRIKRDLSCYILDQGVLHEDL